MLSSLREVTVLCHAFAQLRQHRTRRLNRHRFRGVLLLLRWQEPCGCRAGTDAPHATRLIVTTINYHY